MQIMLEPEVSDSNAGRHLATLQLDPGCCYQLSPAPAPAPGTHSSPAAQIMLSQGDPPGLGWAGLGWAGLVMGWSHRDTAPKIGIWLSL